MNPGLPTSCVKWNGGNYAQYYFPQSVTRVDTSRRH